MRSRMDNSGTKVEAAARYRLDTREQIESGSGASRYAANATARAQTLLAQLPDTSRVRRRQRAHDHIDLRQPGEHIEPYDFAEPSFHAIAIDG